MKRRERVRRVTISDVCLEAGCSKGVVSAVVNNAKGNIAVSDATRKRVVEAAAKLGYRPNFASRSLARRSTHTIGIYVPPRTGASLGYSYEGRILQGVELSCRQQRYDLLVLNVGGDVAPEECQHRFTEGRIDGLLLLHLPEQAPWLDSLAESALNLVSVNYYGTSDIHSVTFDDHAATAMSVAHLVELGHRRIAYLGGVDFNLGPGSHRRHAGYLSAMAAAGLPVDPRWVWDHCNPLFTREVQARWTTDDVPRAANHLLSLGADRPTAIVCHGDAHAASMLQQCAARGIAVPSEISVVGIDDSDLASQIFPKLTSIRQPLQEMGEHAATMLIENAKGKGTTPATPTPFHAPVLVVRDSTAPPPSQ